MGESIFMIIIALSHTLLGLISVIVGIAASVEADIWTSHYVSPLWSGAFFILTGFLGLLCAKRKSSYMIMAFTASAIVSLITTIVSLQLLRFGLMDDDDETANKRKQNNDVILVAVVCSVLEVLVCIISCVLSCKMAKDAKKKLIQREKETKDNETCPTDVVDEADIDLTLSSKHHFENSSKNTESNVKTSPVHTDITSDDNTTTKNDASDVSIEYLMELDSSGRLPDIDAPKLRRIVNIHKKDNSSIEQDHTHS